MTFIYQELIIGVFSNRTKVNAVVKVFDLTITLPKITRYLRFFITASTTTNWDIHRGSTNQVLLQLSKFLILCVGNINTSFFIYNERNEISLQFLGNSNCMVIYLIECLFALLTVNTAMIYILFLVHQLLN